MNIVMLARNPNLYSHKRLVEAAKERGHEMDIVNPLRCYMNIASRRPTVYYNGEKLSTMTRSFPGLALPLRFTAVPSCDSSR